MFSPLKALLLCERHTLGKSKTELKRRSQRFKRAYRAKIYLRKAKNPLPSENTKQMWLAKFKKRLPSEAFACKSENTERFPSENVARKGENAFSERKRGSQRRKRVYRAHAFLTKAKTFTPNVARKVSNAFIERKRTSERRKSLYRAKTSVAKVKRILPRKSNVCKGENVYKTR